MSGHTTFMTQWVANEAQRLIETGKFNNINLAEARAILSDDTKNGWLGFPEGEMVREYNQNRLLVARFVVWRQETLNQALANLS
tara:strand:+ start:1705 stop:1956 length:252 start_codon:yes stop_codon:yes gene_type:complete